MKKQSWLALMVSVSLLSFPVYGKGKVGSALKTLEKSCRIGMERNKKNIKHFNVPSVEDACSCVVENVKCENFSAKDILFLADSYASEREETSDEEARYKTILDFDFHTAQACMNSTKYRVATCAGSSAKK